MGRFFFSVICLTGYAENREVDEIAAPRIYAVEIDGKTMSVNEYSRLTGVCASTIRWRIKHGQPVEAPIDRKRRKEPGMNAAEKRYTEKHGYRNGYTPEEIEDLYGHFAGNEDELQILMDFTGLGLLQAGKLLQELKYKRRKSS